MMKKLICITCPMSCQLQIQLDEEGQIVDSQSPAGIRLRYERLRKRVGADGGSERQEEREAQKAAEKERVEAEGKTYSDPLVAMEDELNG